ncbi:hypothetical protein V2I94_12115 [Pseudomonas viridiflava]|nr:hypothetical protein [Pseudomonas viridiflava]
MRVSEPTVKNGFFFTPTEPDKRYPGILKILDGGRIELHLTSDENAFVSFDEMFIGRLIGKIEGGYTTLEDCSYETMNLSLGGGAATSLITARIAYIGMGMPEECQFDQFEFAVDELSEWYGKSAFRPILGMKPSDCVIDFGMPSTVTCHLPEGVILEIGMKATFPGKVKYPVTELRQQACLTIKADSCKPLSFFVSLLAQDHPLPSSMHWAPRRDPFAPRELSRRRREDSSVAGRLLPESEQWDDRQEKARSCDASSLLANCRAVQRNASSMAGRIRHADASSSSLFRRPG